MAIAMYYFLEKYKMKGIKRATKLYSVLHLKCPRCQPGDLFLVKSPYRLKTLDKMPRFCPV